MKLSTKGRYAVTAMVDIGKNCGRGPVTLASIAERQEISLSYLEQLFAKLGKCGVVKSTRGPGGGFTLLKPLNEIYISEIVAAADEKITTTRCANHENGGCRKDGSKCLTHDLWEELGDVINNFLASVTLEDVVEGRLSHNGVCHGKKDFNFLPEKVAEAG